MLFICAGLSEITIRAWSIETSGKLILNEWTMIEGYYP